MTLQAAVPSRPASEEDREFVFRVRSATLRYAVEATWGWDEALQRSLSDERFRPEETDILLEGEQRIGFLKVRREPDAIYLASIYLLPPWQSRGLGTAIVEDLQRRAVREEVPIRLQVLRANDRARALYERLGFEITETTPTHHRMRWSPSAPTASRS